MQAREPALFLWENAIAVAILLRFLAYFSGRNVPNMFHFFNAIFDATGFRGLFLSK